MIGGLALSAAKAEVANKITRAVDFKNNIMPPPAR
jgi:hypothetical protein